MSRVLIEKDVLGLEDALNVADFERLARPLLSESAWGYYASGADDESTLKDNRAAFARWKVFYRVLVDVSRRELATRVLGHEVAMPVLLAPTAFHKLAHADGEVASARAAGEAGTITVLSTLSTTPVEEVVAATSGPVFFQLYVYKDRGATRALVERVAAAGCKALVLTVDAPFLGRRERDIRNRFTLPDGMRVENMLAALKGDLPEVRGSGLTAYFASLIDPALTWTDIDWLRSIADLPIIVKGIVRVDDARRAASMGVAGIVVSNHGGRQMDTAPATIDALPMIADAVGDELEILLDGGVRRGTDVLKALALGARAVLVGRPVLWGLAAGGSAGVSRVLSLLRQEFDLAMGLAGCPAVADITRDLVARS